MDWLVGILYNPLVLAGVGIIVKFVPGVRAVISNRAIPFINIILAWLAALIGPEAAHAAGGPLVILGVGGFLGIAGGFLGGLGGALWQSAQAWVFNEWLLRQVTPARPPDSKR